MAPKSNRGGSFARQIQLIQRLDRDRTLVVEEAARELKCARRTVYRDLVVLEANGWPLYQEQVGKTKRWRMLGDYRRKLSIGFSLEEVMALVAAEQLLGSMPGTVFATAARNAVAKLKNELAPPIRERLEKLSPMLTASAGPVRNLKEHGEHLQRLLKAAEECRVVDMTYQKLGSTKPERYTIEPHELHMQGSGVYVVAWARERNAARIFLLDRVSDVALRAESFARRPELPTGAFEQGAFGLWEGPAEYVAIRFSGTATRIVSEQKLHPSQRLRTEGKSLLLELVVPLSPTLVAWVRGFGSRAAVVAPDALKKLC